VSGAGNNLDFGARIYDGRLGRWMSVDPLQFEYASLSSYCFVGNNPLAFVDPDGRKVKVGWQHKEDVQQYLVNLGLDNAFKIKRNGEVKVVKRWERKNADNLAKDADLNDIYYGLKAVVEHKTKTIYVNIEEGNYDHSRQFPVYEMQKKKAPIYEEFPDGKGGVILKQIGFEEVEKKVFIGYTIVGANDNKTSKTFYFGEYDPNNIDVILHRQDMKGELDGKDGKMAPGSETSTFIHELLDHGLDFMRYGMDKDADGIGNDTDVNFENKTRRKLKIPERSGTDHDKDAKHDK
jgi:hypothetical protein